MAKDILKEAIADAKAVREVALANAKAALEEAFTPKLQSMLSAKLSEDLDEEYDEDMDEMMTYDEDEDMDEMMTYDEDMDENIDLEEKDEKEKAKPKPMPTDPSDEDREKDGVGESLSGEIDLEELLSELENMDEKEIPSMDTIFNPNDPDRQRGRASTPPGDASLEECPPGSGNFVPGPCPEDDDMMSMRPNDDMMSMRTSKPLIPLKGDEINENEEFDLDALINEIAEADMMYDDMDEDMMYDEDMDEDMMYDEDMDEGHCAEGMYMTAEGHCMEMNMMNEKKKSCSKPRNGCPKGTSWNSNKCKCDSMKNESKVGGCGCKKQRSLETQLKESNIALNTVREELNEVNLLNSKLLYVNRIFKSNNLSESNKIKVVETLDKAMSTKEAKLIYETIKDTFKLSDKKKRSSKKSIRENFGMASKAAGIYQAPRKEIISESTDMVARFKKLANIKINE